MFVESPALAALEAWQMQDHVLLLLTLLLQLLLAQAVLFPGVWLTAMLLH